MLQLLLPRVTLLRLFNVSGDVGNIVISVVDVIVVELSQ